MAIGDPVSALANGNIHVYCAVKLDTTRDFRILEAGAGNQCIGIAQKGERRDPSNSDGLAAIAGEPLYYWGNGAKDVPARLGDTVTAGDRLKAGTGGKLVTASTEGDEFVAIAKQSGVEDDLIAVDVDLGQIGA